MKIEDAIIARIEQLKIEKGLSQYKLSEKSGVPQTTLVSIKRKRSINVGVSTIHKICEAYEIDMQEFFNSPLFKELDNSEY